MIVLLIVYCLAAAKTECVEQREMVANPMACVMGVQQEAAEFVGAHPEYGLAGWTCRRDADSKTPA